MQGNTGNTNKYSTYTPSAHPACPPGNTKKDRARDKYQEIPVKTRKYSVNTTVLQTGKHQEIHDTMKYHEIS